MRHLAARLGCAETKVATWDDLAFKLIILGWNVKHSTDTAKISRKRSKPDKHGHGKGKRIQEPGECYQSLLNDEAYNGRAYWTLLAYPCDKLELLKALLSTFAFV
ncbi:hypothetical protein Tco_0343165 [Tanacetum coccineum]